jgi:hypothetical protein
MSSFVWNTVEFMANIAVIIYVLSKLGYINASRMVKKDVPATLADQVRDTANLAKTFTEVLGSMKGMLPGATVVPPAPAK